MAAMQEAVQNNETPSKACQLNARDILTAATGLCAPSCEGQDVRDVWDVQLCLDLLAQGLCSTLSCSLLLFDHLVGWHHPLTKLLRPCS